MTMYLIVSLSIVLLAFCFELINSKADLNPHRKKLPNYFFTVPTFALLLSVSAFRGDFTADYNSYASLFEQYNRFGFFEVLQIDFYQEKGFITLSRFIGLFTASEVYLFILVSFFILYGFYSQFNKYSSYIWLSVLMFVTVGAYYTSFNTMRQVLAVAIVFAGSKYLYERKLIKYFMVVILASLFHKTALVMVFFYFILNWRIRLRTFGLVGIMLLISMLYLNTFIAFAQQTFYTAYAFDSYGMTGLSFTNAVLPLSLLVFSFLNHKKLDPHNTVNRIWMNAVIFYAFFSITGLSIQLTQRISEFFAPYALLLIPLIVSKFQSNYLKAIFVMALVVVLLLYNYVVLSGTGYDPYYFFWDIQI